MLDITDLKERIRNLLLNNSSVISLVSTRIYFGDLFTLINPTLPCINLDLFEGRNLVSSVDRLGINVYCSSKISYDETDEIFTTVNSCFINSLQDKMVLRPSITPINRLLQAQSPIVYQNISRYIIFYLN